MPIFVACPTISRRPRKRHNSSSYYGTPKLPKPMKSTYNYNYDSGSSSAYREVYSADKVKSICSDKSLTLGDKVYRLSSVSYLKGTPKEVNQAISRISDLCRDRTPSNSELELINSIERYYSRLISSAERRISECNEENRMAEIKSVITRYHKNAEFEISLAELELKNKWWMSKRSKKEINESIGSVADAKIEYNKEYLYALEKWKEESNSKLTDLVTRSRELTLKRDNYISKVKSRSMKEYEYGNLVNWGIA